MLQLPDGHIFVLSADEVVQFLEAVSSLKSRAALTTAYAAGLRASEVAGLRIEDIDSARGVIQVRHGQGAKDRKMLSPQLLGILRTYWRLARPRRPQDAPSRLVVLHRLRFVQPSCTAPRVLATLVDPAFPLSRTCVMGVTNHDHLGERRYANNAPDFIHR